MRNIVTETKILYICNGTIGSNKYHPYYISLPEKYRDGTELQAKGIHLIDIGRTSIKNLENKIGVYYSK